MKEKKKAFHRAQIEYILAGLDDLDVDNLQIGRITAHALHTAAQRCRQHESFDIANVGRSSQSARLSEIQLADELNDMLAAARAKESD